MLRAVRLASIGVRASAISEALDTAGSHAAQREVGIVVK
jgi:hypothetical protein